jgi:hypothetical protein
MRLIPNVSLVQQSSILASGTYAGRTAVVSLQGRCCQFGTMSTSNVTTGEGMACSDCGELYGTYSSVNQYWFDSISPSSSSSFSVSKGPNQRVLTIDSLLSNSTARVPEEMSRFCTQEQFVRSNLPLTNPLGCYCGCHPRLVQSCSERNTDTSIHAVSITGTSALALTPCTCVVPPKIA